MSKIYFAKGPEDSGDPSGVVFRPQADGTYQLSVVQGSEDAANFAIFLLKDMLEHMTLADAIPHLGGMYVRATGNDIEEMRKRFFEGDEDVEPTEPEPAERSIAVSAEASL